MSFANECIRKPAALRQPTLFSASTLDVILQRLMPLYRLRQTGESMTLLPSATHIDIAAAMALWILGIGTSCGVCHPSMITKVIRKTGCFYCNRHKLSETRIMRLIRINFFAPCTKWYTSANNSKTSETRIMSLMRSKIFSQCTQ